MRIGALLTLVVMLPAATVVAQNQNANCSALPTAAQLRTWLVAAALPANGGRVGGIFEGVRMWAAVVNRDGEFCAANTSMTDPTQVWPGSQAIAKSKAYTANAFSLDTFALSTARLYTFTQPKHSLWSLAGSNVFDTGFLKAPGRANDERGDIPGGQI